MVNLFNREFYINTTENYIKQIRERGDTFVHDAMVALKPLEKRPNPRERDIGSLLSFSLLGRNLAKEMGQLSEDEAKFAESVMSAVVDIVTASVD